MAVTPYFLAEEAWCALRCFAANGLGAGDTSMRSRALQSGAPTDNLETAFGQEGSSYVDSEERIVGLRGRSGSLVFIAVTARSVPSSTVAFEEAITETTAARLCVGANTPHVRSAADGVWPNPSPRRNNQHDRTPASRRLQSEAKRNSAWSGPFVTRLENSCTWLRRRALELYKHRITRALHQHGRQLQVLSIPQPGEVRRNHQAAALRTRAAS